MRGRKPLPTVLKIERNNPGRRPLNVDEPQHDPLSIDCPAELTDEGRDEWLRVTKELVESGQVTLIDRSVLLGYCLKYGQWLQLEREASNHPYIVRAPSGYPIPNPALGMANRAFALMLKAAAELGMTPSTRTRVKAKSLRTPVDKMKERYFGRRGA